MSISGDRQIPLSDARQLEKPGSEANHPLLSFLGAIIRNTSLNGFLANSFVLFFVGFRCII